MREFKPHLIADLSMHKLARFIDKAHLIRNRRLNNMTYRECFGFENPEPGTKLDIDYSDGFGFFIIWKDCPDDENIIEGWFKKRHQAVSYIKAHGWRC